MDFELPPPKFDDTLYSEQMHESLSDDAKLARSIQNPPRRKFDRAKFLDAMDEAYEQVGGVRRLTMWADKNLTEFYRLFSKTIPQAQLLELTGKMQMQILPALPPSPLDGDYTDVTPVPKEIENATND